MCGTSSSPGRTRHSPTSSRRCSASGRRATTVWEARTLNLIGLCHLALGPGGQAADAVRSAAEDLREEGQARESVVTLHNRGLDRLLPGGPSACAAPLRRGGRAVRRPRRGPARPRPRPVRRAARCRPGRGNGRDLGQRLATGSLPAAQQAELLLTQALADLGGRRAFPSMTSASGRALFGASCATSLVASRSELAADEPGAADQRTAAGRCWRQELVEPLGRRLSVAGADVAARRLRRLRHVGGRPTGGREIRRCSRRLAAGRQAGARRRTSASDRPARPGRELPDRSLRPGPRDRVAGAGPAARAQATAAACSRRAGVDWTRWTSTGRPWAARSCGPGHPARRRAGGPGAAARSGQRTSRAAGVERALARQRR